MWPGCILETYFGPFRPPGRYKKTRKNSYTPRTQRPHSSRCWSCRNPAAPTRRPAPIKALMTTPTLGEACAVLVKPGEARSRRRACRRPPPRLLRRWYSADRFHAFTVRAFCTGAFGGVEGAALQQRRTSGWSSTPASDAPTVVSWGIVERRPGWERGCDIGADTTRYLIFTDCLPHRYTVI